jgi:transmembrane sensor
VLQGVDIQKDKVVTDAMIWLARIERGLEAQEASQLRQWLLQPAHRDEIVNAAKLWHGPDIAAVLAELVPVGFGSRPPPMPRISRTFPILVGAILALFMAASILLPRLSLRGREASVLRDEEIYSTGVGETRAIKLPDGSHLVMNGRSTLYVLYTASTREATVAQGEVIFEVRKGPSPFRIFVGQRHFEVPAARLDVQVIGPKTVNLTVLEGGVTVKGLPYRQPESPAEARNFDPRVFADASIGPLQSELLDDETLIQRPVTAADAHRQLRWEPQSPVYVSL